MAKSRRGCVATCQNLLPGGDRQSLCLPPSLTSKLGSSRKDKATTCSEKKRGYRYHSTWYSCSMRCLLLPLQQKEAPPSQHALLLSDTLLTALTTSTCVKVHVCALGIYLWYWDPTQGFSMAGMCSVAELPRSSQTIFQYLAQSLLSRSLL